MAIAGAQVQPEVERSADEEDQRREQAKRRAAVEVLTAWLETEDKEEIREQQETLAYLQRVLDEDRPSYRKLFPRGQ